MKIKMLVLAFAVLVQSAFAQAVTLADVQKGLTTISNSIVTLKAYRAKAATDATEAKAKINAEVQAGVRSASEVDADFHAIESRAAQVAADADRRIAALKLQDINIRERYKAILKP